MDSSPPTPKSRQLQWSALTFSLALIALALSVTKPWERSDNSPFGIVAQVPPASANGGDLTTGTGVGQLSPNFLLTTTDGQTIRLSDLRGQPVLINFWATWCIFCVSEMPAMQRLADRYDGQLVVVGINVGESISTMQTFARNFEIRYPLVRDADNEVTRTYQVQAMPTSLIIDSEGVVQSVSYGVLTPPQMEELVRPLLVNQ